MCEYECMCISYISHCKDLISYTYCSPMICNNTFIEILGINSWQGNGSHDQVRIRNWLILHKMDLQEDTGLYMSLGSLQWKSPLAKLQPLCLHCRPSDLQSPTFGLLVYLHPSAKSPMNFQCEKSLKTHPLWMSELSSTALKTSCKTRLNTVQ